MKSLLLSGVLALASLGLIFTTASPAEARPRRSGVSVYWGPGGASVYSGPRSYDRYYYPDRYYYGRSYYSPRYYYGSGYRYRWDPYYRNYYYSDRYSGDYDDDYDYYYED